MQVTTLNKIINLFLVGTFVIIVIATKYVSNIRSLDKARLDSITSFVGSPIIVFVATLFLLSVIILLGMVVESLADMSVKRLVDKLSNNKRFTRFIALKKPTEEHDYQLSKFNELFKQDDRYKALADDRGKAKASEEDNNKSIAVGLFFHTATKENVEYVTQHFSIYLLATSYLFVLCCTLLAIIFAFSMGFLYKLLAIAVNLLFIFAMIRIAIAKNLYSYEIVYRHGRIILCGKIGEEKTGVSFLSNR